jgi:glycosyltransferase A (GT-A) superfamily protein (DUF2064 family)
MQTPERWPLVGIPWGSSEVLDTTLESAQCNNLTVGLLPQRQDLDHLRDLKRWQG